MLLRPWCCGLLAVLAVLSIPRVVLSVDETNPVSDESEAIDVNRALVRSFMNLGKLVTLRGDWWRRPAAAPVREQHGLIHRSAPDFELKLLTGEPVKLSQHRGKNVVVIDFWATWCGPCRRGLPAVSRIAKKFEGEPVVVWAMNLGDSQEEVREFLAEEGLELSVVLDPEGSVATAYQIEAIPCTMIVDLDGTIQVVHVGLSPNFERELDQEISALLGKSPARDL